MSESTQGAALAAILDALTLVQNQLEEIGERSRRLEANQAGIIARLDTIDAAQAGVTDLQPQLEHILAELTTSRLTMREGFARVAQVAGWAHAAAVGNSEQLPADILDDPLLERFVISQPADRISDRRALVDWRRTAKDVGTAVLTEILAMQYIPSPTDDAPGRILRYQLAAITRAELDRRGAPLPPLPPSTTVTSQSQAARQERSAELLRAWRAGEGAMLYAEPELAGALDIVAAARREGAALSEADLSNGLAALHETIAIRIEAGDRPALAIDHQLQTRTHEPDRKR